MGAVEDTDALGRVEDLRDLPAAVQFLSCKPLLLGPLTGLDLTDIGWVITGGEPGPRARPADPSWVRQLRDMAIAADVPYFFKQWEIRWAGGWWGWDGCPGVVVVE